MSLEWPLAACNSRLFQASGPVAAYAVVPHTAPAARKALTRCITSLWMPAAPFKPQFTSTAAATGVTGATGADAGVSATATGAGVAGAGAGAGVVT